MAVFSKRALGLLFLFITAASWIGASFITQALVAPGSGGGDAPELEPWLLALICSSTFMIYLPIGHFIRRRARAAASTASKSVNGGDAAEGDAEASAPMLKGKSKDRAPRGAEASAAACGPVPPDQERQPLLLEPLPEQGRGVHVSHYDLSYDPEGRGVEDVGQAEQAEADGALRNSADEGTAADEGDVDVDTRQIVRAALLVAPVWFAAQLAFTASLEFTSVTSNTVLSSCSSLFVYLGSLALGQEVGSHLRLASVISAMAGTTLVALGDSRARGSSTDGGADGGGGGGANGGGSSPLLGDALTLLAAALYATYTLIMKRMLVKDDGAVTALFFGVIGLLCFAILLPLAGGLAAAGSDVVLRVTGPALGLALLQGLIDYVAADYAWARAVMLLGPTATSCGLAMQIPAAAVVDSLVNGNRLAWSDTPASLAQFLLGSILIIGGFVGVSLDPRVVEAAWRRWRRRAGGGADTSGVGGIGGSFEPWQGHGQGGKQANTGGLDGTAGAVRQGAQAAGPRLEDGAASAGASARARAPPLRDGLDGAGGSLGEGKQRVLGRVFGASGARVGSGEAVYIPLGDAAGMAGGAAAGSRG